MVRVPKIMFLNQSFSIKTVKSFYGRDRYIPMRELITS